MSLRNGIQEFGLANPIYKGATVTFYTVSGGIKTATKATLYASPTTTTTLPNPQHLGADGKFIQPVYVEVEVIATISGLTIPDHDTSTIQSVLGAGSVIDLPAIIHTAGAKATPVAADEFGFWDSVSGLLKKMTWANFLAIFSAPSGSSLVGFLQAGAGAVARTMQDKERDFVNIADFAGFDSTGVTNSVPALLSAFNSLGAAGGTVYIPPKAKVLIDSTFTIPLNVQIKGAYEFVGIAGGNTGATFGNLGAIIVNPANTITMASGSGLFGCLIYRKGMALPSADSSLFSGTAITSAGDDVFISDCMVLGFNTAFTSTGFQRAHIHNFYHDNINGIVIAFCLDISYLSNCHAWPFSTLPFGPAGVKDGRSGTAYNFISGGDWNKITNCFCWGYTNGFIVNACNNMTLLSCGADGGGPVGLNTGFQVLGGSYGSKLIDCQTSGQNIGYKVSTLPGQYTTLVNCDAWSIITSGILANGGEVRISGGYLKGCLDGILLGTAGSAFVDGVYFYVNTNSDINIFAPSLNYFIGSHNSFSFPAGTNPIANPANLTVASIASAASPLLPNNGVVFNITGVTNFGTLLGGWLERKITLVFGGILTVGNGTGSYNAIRLNGGLNFTTAAGSTLTLVHNGVQWYEVGRCA